MITIPQIIEQKISNTPFLEEYLNQGLINISSLARQLQPEIEKELGKTVNVSTIIMAINRMSFSTSQLHIKRIQNTLKEISDISIRSSLIDYTYKNSGNIRKCIGEFIQKIQSKYDVFFTLSQGIYESTLIVNKDSEELLTQIFKKEICVGSENDITAINIRLPENNTEIKGIYYMIFKTFTDNNINVKDVVSTSNELTLLINSIDSEKAFLAINKLKS